MSVVLACGVLAAACGSSSPSGSPSSSSPPSPTPPSSPALTQAQIGNLATTFANAENSALVRLFIVQFFNEANDAYNAGSTATSFPINVSAACADAGTAGLTGTVMVTGNPGPGGKYALNANLVIAFSKCTSAGIELDGTLPSTGQINGDNTNPGLTVIVNPVSFTISGTSTFVLNGVTGTAAFSCSNTLSVNLQAGTSSGITSTGNATLQYPTGQNPATAPCSTFSSGFNGLSLSGAVTAWR